jgi:hypothetical protein
VADRALERLKRFERLNQLTTQKLLKEGRIINVPAFSLSDHFLPKTYRVKNG